MCGRFTLISDLETIAKTFKIASTSHLSFQPRYNIAPGQLVLAVISDGRQYRIGYLRWGLVPHWAKDQKIGYKMINARAETIDKKPAFRNLFFRRRCLIPADGFYEWKQEKGKKQPYRIIATDRPLFAFAGLWDRWEQHGQMIDSCTIITTSANEKMAAIHERMPVILEEESWGEWLNPKNRDASYLKMLLRPYPAKKMKAYQISERVNSARNDDPEVIEPLN